MENTTENLCGKLMPIYQNVFLENAGLILENSFLWKIKPNNNLFF